MSLTIVFIMAFWLFEICMFVYTLAVLDDAAHEGIRYAISHGTDSSACSGPSAGCTDSAGANVVAKVTAVAASAYHNVSGMKVTVSYPDTTGSAPGSLVKVAISYPYVPLVKIIGFSETANISAEGRIAF